MKELVIASRRVTIETEKLSKGLADLHAEDPERAAALAFGMLDGQIIEHFEKNFEKSVKKQFSEVVNIMWEDEINAFIKTCREEITTGIYSHAKMIV